MNKDTFERVLIKHGLVDRSAIEDAEHYDNFNTQQRVRSAFEELSLRKEACISTNDSELLKKARDEFEYKTWTHANKTKTYHARLYDAGELGYCILNFKHNAWSNQWFDNAEQIHAY